MPTHAARVIGGTALTLRSLPPVADRREIDQLSELPQSNCDIVSGPGRGRAPCGAVGKRTGGPRALSAPALPATQDPKWYECAP